MNYQAAIVSDIWTDTVLEVWDRWYSFTKEEDYNETAIVWEFDSPAKVAVAGREDTAFHARDPHYCVIVFGRNDFEESDEVVNDFVSSTTDYIRKADALKTGKDLGVTLCYARGHEAPEHVFGVNLPRLRKLKAKYDPKKVWSKGFVIEPDFS